MKIFRNRTVVGVLCILLALIICFGVTPLFSRSASEKTEIVRVTKDIKEGDEITAEMVQTVEVGAYNLPQNLMTDKKEVVGKYATADLAAGDYILSSKLSAVPAAENAYLYNLDGKNRPSPLPSRALPPAFPVSWKAAISSRSSWRTIRARAKQPFLRSCSMWRSSR